MSRLSRRYITEEELGIKFHGGLNDLFDNSFKNFLRITDDEYDYICEFASDEELHLFTEENTKFGQKRLIIMTLNKLLTQYKA